MMKGVMKALTPHRVLDSKADSWKERKEDLEFWELHYQGMQAVLRTAATTGNAEDVESDLGP